MEYDAFWLLVIISVSSSFNLSALPLFFQFEADCACAALVEVVTPTALVANYKKL